MRKQIKLLLILLMIFIENMKVNAQPSSESKEVNSLENRQQKMPQFPGGDDAFYEFLDKNVELPLDFDKKKYLEEHHNQYVPISIGFTVDTDGSIINVKVIDGENDSLNSKAKEIVQKMPKCEPGHQNGSPIKVEFVIPIRFNLM